MKAKNLFYLILLGAVVACAEKEEEIVSSPTPATATRNISFLNESMTDYTISAFREENNGFVFLNTFSSSGNADGRAEIQLPVGNYQFLVATGYGGSILQFPQLPEQGNTQFNEMKFVAQPIENNETNLQAGEELFLQDNLADSVYQLYTATTIQLNLKRAVSQATLFIKRGRKTGDNQFEAIPYEQDSIIRYFNQIELRLENVGTSLDIHNNSDGEASMITKYPAAAYDSITKEGFATFTGPFFFPPKEKKPLQLEVKLYPAEDSPQPELSLTTTGKVGRNERLVITVWITNDWNHIGISADTQPIHIEKEGDTGIWDNTVTTLQKIETGHEIH